MNNIHTKKFISIDDAHSFEITIHDDYAFFIIGNVVPEHYKTFLLILKDGFQYMTNNNVKYVKQYINITDVEFFINSTKSYYNDYVIIKTDIEYFLDEICNGLGIKKL